MSKECDKIWNNLKDMLQERSRKHRWWQGFDFAAFVWVYMMILERERE